MGKKNRNTEYIRAVKRELKEMRPLWQYPYGLTIKSSRGYEIYGSCKIRIENNSFSFRVNRKIKPSDLAKFMVAIDDGAYMNTLLLPNDCFNLSDVKNERPKPMPKNWKKLIEEVEVHKKNLLQISIDWNIRQLFVFQNRLLWDIFEGADGEIYTYRRCGSGWIVK